MTGVLTTDDVRSWDLGVLDQLHHASVKLLRANSELAEGLSLARNRTRDWEGQGGDAFRASLGTAHSDISETARRSDRLARALQKAEFPISRCRAALLDIDDAAERHGWTVTSDWQIDTNGHDLDASEVKDFDRLQSELAGVKTQSHSADQDAAAAVHAAGYGVPLNGPNGQSPLDPAPPPPGPPANPFAGWTDQQLAQVAAEIAHGHAWQEHAGDFPGWTEPDLARWIYDTMKDPTTRTGTSIESGGVALLRDGKVVFVDPRGPDYGTAFKPKPRPGDSWRTPEEYFERSTRALEPLPPPVAGIMPPLNPAEMAPPTVSPPAPEPPPATAAPQAPEPPPVEAPRPELPSGPNPFEGGGGGGGGIAGGGGILQFPAHGPAAEPVE